MRARINPFFLLCCVLYWNPAAQQTGAYFLSAENILPIQNPARAMRGHFIYRVQGDKNFVFYRIAMNNLLYTSKYLFAWPKDIPPDKRPYIRFFASYEDAARDKPVHEIIFNADYILADCKTLIPAISGSSPLLPQVRPGITQIQSTAPAEIIRLPAMIGADSLPAFVYSTAETPQFILLRSRSFFSRFEQFSAPVDSFRSYQWDLRALPPIQLTTDTSEFLPDPALSDSARLRLIRAWITSLSQSLRSDSIAVEEQRAEITRTFALPDFLRHQIHNGEQIHEQELNNLLGQASRMGNAEEVLRGKRERLLLLQGLERVLSFDPLQALMQQTLHQRLFWAPHLLIGRNLPVSAANPGPAFLWGGGFQIFVMRAHLANLLSSVALHFDFSRWHYHEKIRSWSSDQRLAAGFHLGAPLLLKIKRRGPTLTGNLLIPTIGLSAGTQWGLIQSDQKSTVYNHPDGALHLGIHATISLLPCLVSLQYQLQRNHYGSLIASIAIPLFPTPSRKTAL